jgi:hypothetical protein
MWLKIANKKKTTLTSAFDSIVKGPILHVKVFLDRNLDQKPDSLTNNRKISLILAETK